MPSAPPRHHLDCRISYVRHHRALAAHHLAQGLYQIAQSPRSRPLVLFTLLALTGLAWYLLLEYSNDRESGNFTFQVGAIESTVRQRMEGYARVLRGGVVLFHSSESVNRNEWKTYIESLDLSENHPGTQGIGVRVVIEPENLQEHIRSVRAEGFPDYQVRPTGERDLYTSIMYLEPLDWRNRRAFGFDMYSEAMRRRAMARAVKTGQPSISSKVTLVQETGQDVQAGSIRNQDRYRHAGGTKRRAATATGVDESDYQLDQASRPAHWQNLDKGPLR